MAVNADENKSVIGVSDVYAALVTADSSGGMTFGTPFKVAPVAEVTVEPKSELKTQYADNIPYDVMSSEGESELKFKFTNIAAEIVALILGRVLDASTGRVYDDAGTPPFIALGFRALKSNNKYRYYWFLKGRFSAAAESFATKTETAEPKEQEISFTAIKSIYEFNLGTRTASVKRVWGDEDTTGFSGTNWFAQVQVPGVAAVSALALSSSVPAAAATGILVGANIVLTFNNALAAGEENDIVLMNATLAVVACARSIDATRKIVTLDPNSNMAASNQHTVSYSVRDIYGQTLEGSFRFTTA